MPTNTRTWNPSSSLAVDRASFMRRVYMWMTGGILVTALVSTYFANNPELIYSLTGSPGLFYGLMFAQLAMVFGLSFAINRISSGTAILLFLSYAALTGITFSTLFLIYTRSSIAGAFMTTACGFLGLSVIGMTTQRDLGPIGTFCGMALFGLIGWGILAMFFPHLLGGNGGVAYSLAGVVIFSGLTAYDTQRIKNLSASFGYGDAEAEQRAAIYGALALYLDFINLFISLLRLMGGERRR